MSMEEIYMDENTWYLIFSGIVGIGALWMNLGKSLDRNEKVGVWTIFGGFVLQTIWYVVRSNWTGQAIALLAGFVILCLIFFFRFRGGRPTLKI